MIKTLQLWFINKMRPLVLASYERDGYVLVKHKIIAGREYLGTPNGQLWRVGK